MSKICTVCIIDDDPMFVLITKKIMQNNGFCDNFVVFNNGQKAYLGLKELMESGSALPDIIILDLNMPVMNGWEFLDNFTHLDKNGKPNIYIVTSSSNISDLEKSKQYDNVCEYITKPITAQALSDISNNVARDL